MRLCLTCRALHALMLCWDVCQSRGCCVSLARERPSTIDGPCTDVHPHDNRRGPTTRELLQWASLAQLLCQRGWAPDQALAAAWRQTYSGAEPSAAGRAAADAAFQEHCSGVTAESCGSDALALSLSKPAAWPLPLGTAEIAADAGAASWAASSAVMTHFLRQLAALESLLSQQPTLHSNLEGLAAASLPAPWLQRHLKGAADGISSAALLESLGGTGACEDAMDRAALFVHLAAACLIERTPLNVSFQLAQRRLQHISDTVCIPPFRHSHICDVASACLTASMFPSNALICASISSIVQTAIQRLSFQDSAESAGAVDLPSMQHASFAAGACSGTTRGGQGVSSDGAEYANSCPQQPTIQHGSVPNGPRPGGHCLGFDMQAKDVGLSHCP